MRLYPQNNNFHQNSSSTGSNLYPNNNSGSPAKKQNFSQNQIYQDYRPYIEEVQSNSVTVRKVISRDNDLPVPRSTAQIVPVIVIKKGSFEARQAVIENFINPNYRQVPVRTGEVNQTLLAARKKLQNPNSGIVPVKIYSKPKSNQFAEVQKVNNFQAQSRVSQPNFKINPTNFSSKNSNSNIYTEDFQTAKKANFAPSFTSVKPASFESKFYTQDKKVRGKKASKTRPKFKIKLKYMAAVMLFILSFGFLGAGGFLYFSNTRNIETSQVAGASEEAQESQFEKIEEYKAWASEIGFADSDPAGDEDNDELTNYEEFLIGSDPLSANTCDENQTDSQNLFNFINPVDCKPVDLNNPQELEKFAEIISFSELQSQLNQSLIQEEVVPTAETQAVITSSDLNTLFGVQDFKELDTIKLQDIDTQISEKNSKKEYLRIIQKTEAYIKRYRSYETFDRNYSAPVHSATYLQTSIQYNVPLKYVLAIARVESRFGTDRFTESGNKTRPGQYQNIYSIGLTDSGSNKAFPTWEAGVEGFGKWYQNLQKRGIGDCVKWRIYNPNGDYCAKIEKLAAEIDAYIKT
jgi:hypothetical protein